MRFYDKRGTAEQWTKEGKQAAKRDRVQPGEPVAAADPATTNRELVADEFAPTAGENRGRLVKHARY